MKTSYFRRLDSSLWALPGASLALAPLLVRRAWEVQYVERYQYDHVGWVRYLHFLFNASLADLALVAPLTGLLAVGIHRYLVKTGRVDAAFGVLNWCVCGVALFGPVLVIPWFYIVVIFVLKWVG